MDAFQRHGGQNKPWTEIQHPHLSRMTKCLSVGLSSLPYSTFLTSNEGHGSMHKLANLNGRSIFSLDSTHILDLFPTSVRVDSLASGRYLNQPRWINSSTRTREVLLRDRVAKCLLAQYVLEKCFDSIIVFSMSSGFLHPGLYIISKGTLGPFGRASTNVPPHVSHVGASFLNVLSR